jgi:serine protease Do
MTLKFFRRPLWPLVATIALTLTIGSTGSFVTTHHLAAASRSEIKPAVKTTPDPLDLRPTTFAPVVQKVMPSVVNIFSLRKVATDTRSVERFFDDPVFRRFLGDEFRQPFIPRDRQERSLGSGVIISSDGYIVTNNHVVDGGTDIKVSLNDTTEFPARIVGTDSKTDLAVLKIDKTALPALPLSDSSKVQVGDMVLAIGNPFGVGQTVTMGIVSATGRALGIEDYEDFIQTDAAINPGNSGGALVSVDGHLIGINTAIMSRSGGNQGVGFAIPASMARNVTDQIIHGGKVSRAFLGVMIQPVTSDLAKAFKLSKNEGALISDVNPSSPAERAGLKPGDVVTKVDDHAVADARALRLMIGDMSPGKTVQLAVVRDGVERRYPVTLGEQPSDKGDSSKVIGGGASSWRALDGVSLEALTPESARQYGLTRNMKGVAVRRVEPNSAAAKAGLEPGDVILEVNRHPVTSTEDVNRYIHESPTDTALLFVNHEGQTRYLAIPTK